MSADNPAKVHAVASPPSPGEADYEAICAAVLATERGRWFLAEYARRNRQADTVELVAAIERIAARSSADAGALWGRPPDNIHGERLRAELAELADAIARTRTEFVSATAGPISDLALEASGGQDDGAAERFDILAAAEEIQELAWTMREQGFDSQFSDRLDRCATICLASSRRERRIERTRKIRRMMRHLQGRIDAIIATWGTVAPVRATGAQTAVACEETQAQDGPSQQGTAPGTDGQATDAPAQAVQASPRAAACGDEGALQDAPKEFSSVVIRPSPEKVEAGRDGGSPVSTDNKSVMAEPPPMHVAPSATTLAIEGPKGSFSIMPARAAEPPGPIPRPALPPEAESTNADVRAFASDLAAEGDRPPPAPSPTAQPPAMAVVAETNGTSPAASTASTGDDDIFREADLPLVAAPQLGGPPQPPVEEPPASVRPSTDIAEHLFADVMALSEEERLALFT